ncbi:MAG TPA: hypothetical protein VFY03_09765 [Woeseiaceae bacterium]|nr:hypothetical protein [Woeseiaceae bacterium]
MQISLKHGFVFFCTPKNASNSIEDMLRPHIDLDLQGSPAVRHTNVRQFRRYLAPYLADVAPETRFETLALVREPVSWLYSWYRFRARSQLRETHHVNSTAHVSFRGFLEAYLEEPQPEFARVGSQAEFLEDEAGRHGIDRLFAYEDLPALVHYLAGRIGEPLSLRAINVSPGRVYRSNLLEKLGALHRRARARLVRDAHPRPQGPDPRDGLPGPLLDALTARLQRDFELHASAQRGPGSNFSG